MRLLMIAYLVAVPLASIAGPANSQTDNTRDAMKCLASIRAMKPGQSDPQITNNLASLEMFYMGRLNGQYNSLDAEALATLAATYQTERAEAAAATRAHAAKPDTGNEEDLASSAEPGMAQCFAAMGQAVVAATPGDK